MEFSLVVARKMAEEEPVNWNVDTEVNLFHAMRKSQASWCQSSFPDDMHHQQTA